MNSAFEGLEIKRDELYIANIVKCRPPANRVPEADEAEACLDYLRNQVILVKPKIIVLLGSTALKNILGKEIQSLQVGEDGLKKREFIICQLGIQQLY